MYYVIIFPNESANLSNETFIKKKNAGFILHLVGSFPHEGDLSLHKSAVLDQGR